MDKKFTVPLLVFLAGMVLTIAGALFKLMHWLGTNLLLSSGMLLQAGTLVVLIVIIFKMSGKK